MSLVVPVCGCDGSFPFFPILWNLGDLQDLHCPSYPTLPNREPNMAQALEVML